MNSHRPWERAIRNFEAEDHRSPPAPGSIVFTGSSSVRFWTTLERDMNPLPVVNRGFGGAHLAHVTHFAPRALPPLAPAAVVLYAGDNDLGTWTGKTAATVARDFVQFVELIRKELLETRIYALSIKPSRLRALQWAEQRRANERIAEFAAREPGVDYLDIATPMLGRDGRARRELFGWDGLHLSEEGYRIWTSVVAPRLRDDFRDLTRSRSLRPRR